MTIISSMDGNSTPSREFLNLLKKLTKQFSLIKWQKYIFFNIGKLQIWYLRCICCNTFLNLFYCQAYISDTSNECSINLSTEQDGDCMKFQKVDVQSNMQLTPTSVLRKTKGHIQGLLRSNKGRRYKKDFKVVFQFIWNID